MTRPRSARRRLLVALLCGLLGFGLAVQVRSSAAGTGLASANPDQLVQVLNDLSARADRLRQEIDLLRSTQSRLANGNQASQAALAETQRRIGQLQILAGTAAARGPGIILDVTDPRGSVHSDVLLDAIEELRDAGAEAMQIDGATGGAVRVVASTYLLDAAGGGITVDGHRLTAPYRVIAIGAPATMAQALGIPGGVLAAVDAQPGAHASVSRSGHLAVTALHPLTAPRYARPAPTPSGAS